MRIEHKERHLLNATLLRDSSLFLSRSIALVTKYSNHFLDVALKKAKSSSEERIEILSERGRGIKRHKAAV